MRFLPLLLLVSLSSVAPPADPYRPVYHFTAPKNWINDANGLVYSEGKYNLFYQYNPLSAQPGHLAWGHATSPDLLHWPHLPVALTEYQSPDGSNTMIFSGSAVVDKDNTSGLFPGGKTNGLVAFYTGHQTRGGVTVAQHQNLASSQDSGVTWQRYAGNPVLDIGSTEFRDPKVFWYAPQQKWVMATVKANRQQVYLYESKDLKQWTFLSHWSRAGDTVKEWECPDLFELPLPGGGTKWVLLISSGNPTEQYRGQQYFLGQFDGNTFTPDQAYNERAASFEMPFQGESYDLELTIEPGKANIVALNVLQSDAEKTALRYDVAKQELTLDRTKSGNVAFNSGFAATLETARVPLLNGQLKLRLLVDKSVVKVFAQDDETTLTDLVFPQQHSGRISLAADGDARLTTLSLRNLS